MADYEWGLDDCGWCGRRIGHTKDCMTADAIRDRKNAEARAKGFAPKGRNSWLCRRGCGCIVWDIEAHIKNVCTTFNPVVGE